MANGLALSHTIHSHLENISPFLVLIRGILLANGDIESSRNDEVPGRDSERGSSSSDGKPVRALRALRALLHPKSY